MNEKLLDEILDYFFKNKTQDIIPFNVKNNFQATPDEFYLCIVDLHDRGFLNMVSLGNLTKPENNIYKIAPKGISFLQEGGFKAKSEATKLQLDKAENREILEIQKLKSELNLINMTLADYNSVKGRAFRSEILAWAALLISIIGVFLGIKGC